MLIRTFVLTVAAAIALDASVRAQTSAAALPGVDCWLPRWEIGMNSPRWTGMRPVLETVEKVVKANRAFMSEMPERVRMEIQTEGADGTLGMVVAAYPRQWGSTPYWSSTGCTIVATSRSSRAYEHPLGSISVNFNRRGVWRADYFNQSGLKPIRFVSGFPVFEYRHSAIGIRSEMLMITSDGRLPIIPVTLGDRLDQEAAFLAKRIEEVGVAIAQKPPSTVEAIQRRELAELSRRVEALKTYRASFSADQLRSPWIRNDGGPQTPQWRQVEAQVKVLQALSSEDQAQVNELGARARTLQQNARTRGTAPEDAARLRLEASALLAQANAIAVAQRQRVEAQVTALRNDYSLLLLRPGEASEANEFKDDVTFYGSSDPNRIQLINVDFNSGESKETTAAAAKVWMDKVEASFDYSVLATLIR